MQFSSSQHRFISSLHIFNPGSSTNPQTSEFLLHRSPLCTHIFTIHSPAGGCVGCSHFPVITDNEHGCARISCSKIRSPLIICPGVLTARSCVSYKGETLHK